MQQDHHTDELIAAACAQHQANQLASMEGGGAHELIHIAEELC